MFILNVKNYIIEIIDVTHRYFIEKICEYYITFHKSHIVA